MHQIIVVWADFMIVGSPRDLRDLWLSEDEGLILIYYTIARKLSVQHVSCPCRFLYYTIARELSVQIQIFILWHVSCPCNTWVVRADYSAWAVGSPPESVHPSEREYPLSVSAKGWEPSDWVVVTSWVTVALRGCTCFSFVVVLSFYLSLLWNFLKNFISGLYELELYKTNLT